MPLRFRQSPETFTVVELPLYELSGEGDHLYVTVRKRGLSTPHLLSQLQRRLKLKEEEIGCAGNKDKEATSTQTLSVPLRVEQEVGRVLTELGVELLEAKRHGHKLRTGKLAGNRFEVVLEGDGPEDGKALRTKARSLEIKGLPNAFGPQRFGDGDVVEQGRLLFLGQRSRKSVRNARFAVSAFQSHVFNKVLQLRQEEGSWPGPLPGDLLKKHDTGGEFIAEERDAETVSRVENFLISPTGPLPGKKMPWPKNEALALEEKVLASTGISTDQLHLSRTPGTRRFLRIKVGLLSISEVDRYHYLVSFSLPAGAYATVLLQELDVTL